MRRDSLLATITVSETFLPALERVSDELARRHPKATREQLLDMIFSVGVLTLHRDLGLSATTATETVDPC